MKSCEERADALGQQFAETAANCPVSVQTLLDAAVGIRNLKGSTITRYQKEFEDAVCLQVSFIFQENISRNYSLAVASVLSLCNTRSALLK